MRCADGFLGKIVVMRFSPGEDILTSLQTACALHGIKNGCVLSGIGSLRSARFYDPIALPDKKAGYGYGDPIQLPGPVELLGMDGFICEGAGGETLLHLHYSLSDENGKGYGGHIIEGNIVLLTVELVIAQIEGVSMLRKYDDDLEVYLLHPEKKKI